jgi:hypothetical protein
VKCGHFDNNSSHLNVFFSLLDICVLFWPKDFHVGLNNVNLCTD